jgi:ribosomal protein S18 acetylase RimI-like enzyme
MRSIRRATPDDCALIREIAAPTWKAAYSEILSPRQMEYMLDMMYSEESLKRQMREGHMFYIACANNAPSGFISFHSQDENLYILEKLYVLPQAQGSGSGRFLMEKAEAYIRKQHPDRHILLELNVNRNNNAVDFYRRMGFRIVREVDEDIGNGFYKNDYIMRKEIDSVEG